MVVGVVQQTLVRLKIAEAISVMIAIIADIVVTVLIVNVPFENRNLFTFFYIYPAKTVPK